MDRFVCVRLIQANGLDLSLFQFDYDLTFAVFFLNLDGTIYGRYGSRSSLREAERDISIEGFGKAMEAVLDLHRAYPANKALFAAKRGGQPRYPVPEAYPSLRERFDSTLDFDGEVARSCLHCHQVRDAERLIYRTAEKPIPDDLLFPWPMPDVVGLTMDPAEKATVAEVKEGSQAKAGGFRAGDEILSIAGQPLVSVADLQWVLQNAEEPSTLKAQVLRNGREKTLTLALDKGWRRASDISWRPTTWDLRRMGTGGLSLEDVPDSERADLGFDASQLALRVQHVGQYGEHAAGKKAGFERGDVIVAFDGRTDRMTESDLIAVAVQKHVPGDQVPATVLRKGKRVELQLPMQ